MCYSCSLQSRDIKLLSTYLAASLIFTSAQRPGAVQNLTISEYNAQVEDDDNEGMFLVDVEHHKTAASHGPAQLFMNSRINSIMKVYLNTIRRSHNAKHLRERFFLEMSLRTSPNSFNLLPQDLTSKPQLPPLTEKWYHQKADSRIN